MNWVNLLQAILVPVLTAFGGWLAGQIKASKEKSIMMTEEWKKEHQTLKDGVAIMLREKIENIYIEYKDKDAIPFEQKEDLDEIYKTYKGLGGNHRGDSMYSILNKKKVQ